MPCPKERDGGCGQIKAAQDQAELQATDAALNEQGPPNHGVAEAATHDADETTAVCMGDPYQQPEILEGASGPDFGCGDDQHLALDSMDEGEDDTKTSEAANGSQEESGEEPKKARGCFSTLASRYAVVQRFLVSYLSDEQSHLLFTKERASFSAI